MPWNYNVTRNIDALLPGTVDTDVARILFLSIDLPNGNFDGGVITVRFAGGRVVGGNFEAYEHNTHMWEGAEARALLMGGLAGDLDTRILTALRNLSPPKLPPGAVT